MSWEYRPQLDGLRTVAVYLVLLFHAGIAAAGGGFIGVDLFFVLSGFLVTNVILSDQDTHGTVRLGRFYARRVRRLLPAAVVVVVVTCLLQLLLVPEPSRLELVDDARAALLYFANWQFIIDASDYFNDGATDSSPFLHFWSLSIEEQYYIVFPLLVWLLLAKGRRGEGTLAGVLAALFALSLAAQVWVARSDVNLAYYATHTRVYQLLAGALLALALRHLARRAAAPVVEEVRQHRHETPGSAWAWAVLATVGLAGVAVLATDLVDVSQSTRGIAATVASVAAIAGATNSPRFRLTRLLGTAVPRYLGQISYGTYLWHWPVILVLQQTMPTRPLYTALLATAIATGLASLSFQVLETPIRRTPRLHPFSWPVVGAGLALSVLVAATVVGPVLTDPARPAVAAAGDQDRVDLSGELAWTTERIPRDLPLGELGRDEGDLGADCAAGTPESCVVVDGPASAPHVVLVGDSHAGMLLTAFARLAEEKGFRLSSNIRNKCAWVEGIYNRTERDEVNEPCREQREQFYDEILPAMDADLVVVTQRARDGYETAARDVVAYDAAEHPDETFHQMLLRHIEGTTAKVTATGARLLIVHSFLSTNGFEISGFFPLDCLAVARTQGECAVPPVDPPELDSLYDYVAVTDPDTDTVEFRDVYCPAGVLCAPIVDGLVTWKDKSHLSTEFLVAVREALWADMAASGAFDGTGLARRR